MLECVNVVKEFKVHGGTRQVLKGVNMKVGRGEKVGILGYNGAGKSTIMRIIGGVDVPSSGYVRRDMSLSWPLGFTGAFQGSLSGLDNLRFICRIYGKDYRRTRDYVENFAQLGNKILEPVKTFSSGMRARLAFALSLIIEFDCYLIDEVIMVGDIRFTEKCKKELFGKKGDKAMILVSHNMNFVKEVCDRCVFLYGGKMYDCPSVEEGVAVYNSVSGQGKPAPKKPAPQQQKAGMQQPPAQGRPVQGRPLPQGQVPPRPIPQNQGPYRVVPPGQMPQRPVQGQAPSQQRPPLQMPQRPLMQGQAPSQQVPPQYYQQRPAVQMPQRPLMQGQAPSQQVPPQYYQPRPAAQMPQRPLMQGQAPSQQVPPQYYQQRPAVQMPQRPLMQGQAPSQPVPPQYYQQRPAAQMPQRPPMQRQAPSQQVPPQYYQQRPPVQMPQRPVQGQAQYQQGAPRAIQQFQQRPVFSQHSQQQGGVSSRPPAHSVRRA